MRAVPHVQTQQRLRSSPILLQMSLCHLHIVSGHRCQPQLMISNGVGKERYLAKLAVDGIGEWRVWEAILINDLKEDFPIVIAP